MSYHRGGGGVMLWWKKERKGWRGRSDSVNVAWMWLQSSNSLCTLTHTHTLVECRIKCYSQPTGWILYPYHITDAVKHKHRLETYKHKYTRTHALTHACTHSRTTVDSCKHANTKTHKRPFNAKADLHVQIITQSETLDTSVLVKLKPGAQKQTRNDRKRGQNLEEQRES